MVHTSSFILLAGLITRKAEYGSSSNSCSGTWDADEIGSAQSPTFLGRAIARRTGSP